MLFSAMFVVVSAMAEQAPNPRATGVASGAAARGDVRPVVTASGAGADTVPARSATRRSAGASTVRAKSANVIQNSGVSSRSAARVVSAPATASRAGNAASARSATASRSAVSSHSARSAISPASVSRAGSARATAIFNDISKIGGGYAACREAYATCMDQFCANANDTYRRCYCSDRFTSFHSTENALDQAKTLLLQFQDNNLNAVDKTAAEVKAMYSATAGEQAIRRDTSAAQSMLDEISDLLSGKKTVTTSGASTNSLGVLSFDFSSDMDDIWSGGADGLFSGGGSSDLSAKEGAELYRAANNQCQKMVDASCESTAVLNMAKSAYSIMITQDCNLYEKKIDSQRETVKQTVREAEKILRTARLDEYRSHNSADVNECLDKVRSAILADAACGANYKKCLDYTGMYINVNTGEPIYSPRLFQLQNLIDLGSVDSYQVVSQDSNSKFNDFLNSKKMFAESALDTCRDIKGTVWDEFKRAALIEIAQAQDAKIEEVKMSCVSTMAECYDTQTGALKSFDNSKSQNSGAQVAYTAKVMCQDKVSACAALYGNNTGCEIDAKSGRVTNAQACGLAALLNFVDTVDNARIAEGCETAITNYVQDLCAANRDGQSYPWGCRSMDKNELETNIQERAVLYCKNPSEKGENYTDLDQETQRVVERIIDDLNEEMAYALADECSDLGGVWLDFKDAVAHAGETKLEAFYSNVFGGNQKTTYGTCFQNNERVMCESYNSDDDIFARYDAARKECIFTDEWYRIQCEGMGGYFENSYCYIPD